MNRIHTISMRLRCLTPVFAGNGEKFKPSEYIYDRYNQRVYFLKESAWIQFLYDKRIFPSYSQNLIEKISQGGTFSIYEWLENHFLRQSGFRNMQELLRDLETKGVVEKGEKADVKAPSQRNRGRYHAPRDSKGSVNEVLRFARTAGEVYIPGSTLKGAFRTAVLVQMIDKASVSTRTRLWGDVSRSYNKWSANNAGKDLEKTLATGKLRNLKKPDFVLDSLFRGLSVSDAMPESYELGIVQKVDWGDQAAKRGRDPKNLPIYRESLLPGSMLTFQVSIDASVMAEAGIQNVDDLLEALRAFTNLQHDLIRKIFDSSYLDAMEKADLLLGGGTGYISKTLVYPLAPDKEAGTRVVRKLMTDQFRWHKHEEDRDISPHTMKLTRWNGEIQMMGLCQLEVLSDDCLR